MTEPLQRLATWLEEERLAVNPFPQGAVLATRGADGRPHARMMRVALDEELMPFFLTSRGSRKADDIAACADASIAWAFQASLRSVSLEGRLEPMSDALLEARWAAMEPAMQARQSLCGARSGQWLDDADALQHAIAAAMVAPQDRMRPDSFVGYRLVDVTRAEFYSVVRGGLDLRELAQREAPGQAWHWQRLVP